MSGATSRQALPIGTRIQETKQKYKAYRWKEGDCIEGNVRRRHRGEKEGDSIKGESKSIPYALEGRKEGDCIC